MFSGDILYHPYSVKWPSNVSHNDCAKLPLNTELPGLNLSITPGLLLEIFKTNENIICSPNVGRHIDTNYSH